jgi:hypothetical protein
MTALIKRLREFDLTKTEALMIINLGIGLDRPKTASTNGQSSALNTGTTQQNDDDKNIDNAEAGTEVEDDENADQSRTSPLDTSDQPDGYGYVEMETSEGYHQYLLARVVENIEERFPGEEGEEKIRQILNVLKEVIPPSSQPGAR